VLALFIAAAATAGPAITGTAIAGDGDSLQIRGEPIRLYGIDAPEFDQTCIRAGRPWQCGADAASHLGKLITGKELRCVSLGRDQYDRRLARCTTAFGTDINRAMVETGYAVAFRKYSLDYVAAEDRAKQAKLGLWAGTFEMPSEYRAEKHGSKAPRAGGRRARQPQSLSASAGGCVIKGNHSRRGEWIYHLPGMPYYEQTRAEAMFCSEAEAQAAGYRRARVR
jgi:endonuclease YncB( thermonuclease family)